MIHFVIKFLICFSKPEEPVKKGPTKKNPVKPPTPAKKKGKQAETPVAEECKPVVKDENIIECSGNTRNWCHIEYCLFDGVLPKVEINVVTWGPAAKVCKIPYSSVLILPFIHIVFIFSVNNLIFCVTLEVNQFPSRNNYYNV